MSNNKLSRFSIVFASDVNKGISRAGKCPWSSEEDANFFRNLTIGRGKNVVIVGRLTYERMFGEVPLSKRSTFVISKKYSQEHHPGIHVFSCVKDALAAAALGNFEEVFIGGGCSLFTEITTRWMYLCNAIHWTQFKTDYKCDIQFPGEILEGHPTGKEAVRTQSFIRHHLKPNYIHLETSLLDLLKRLISDEGGLLVEKHLYGRTFEFDLSETFPFLTTNQVDVKYIYRLFLFALNGSCDVKILEDAENKTLYGELNELTSIQKHDQKGDGLDEGDMGPWWGWLSRNWGCTYEGLDSKYNSKDQLIEAIESIRKTRKGVILLSDPKQDDYSAVPTRYGSMEFIATSDRSRLDLLVHVHQMEVIDEMKNDIALFGLYLLAMSSFVGARPRTLKFLVNDFWALKRETVEKQLQRVPLPLPNLTIRNHAKVKTPDDLDMNSWILKFQDSWSVIKHSPEDLRPVSKKK